jgi:hypothetical protein
VGFAEIATLPPIPLAMIAVSPMNAASRWLRYVAALKARRSHFHRNNRANASDSLKRP